MTKFLLSAAALAIAVPAMAQMQARPAPPVAPMTQPARPMDATQTRDQVVAKVREHFARMDTNRDGFVAGDELQATGRGAMGGHGGMDRQMTRREGPIGDPAAAFDRLDSNHDGMISRDEFGRAREVRMERRVVMNGTPGAIQDGEQGGMGRMHGMGGGGMGGGMHGAMMKFADLDRDGRVSLQEATTSALQRFDRADTNRDGRITPDERRSNREQRRQMRALKAG